MVSKKDIERFIRENNLPIDDVNMCDELTHLRNKYNIVLEQRNKYMDSWNKLDEYVSRQSEINPSNHQYKKIINAMREIEEEIWNEN